MRNFGKDSRNWPIPKHLERPSAGRSCKFKGVVKKPPQLYRFKIKIKNVLKTKFESVQQLSHLVSNFLKQLGVFLRVFSHIIFGHLEHTAFEAYAQTLDSCEGHGKVV